MPLYVARPHGHDAAHAALRRARVAAVAAGRGRRRGRSSLSASRCQVVQLVVEHPPSRGAARRDRRSRGTGARSNGRRPRRRRCSTSRCCRKSRAWRPTGCSKQRAIEQARRCDRSPTITTSRCRATAPTGFICAFFATFMGFALIWHIWWLVAVAFVGALAVFVVFAWRDEHEEAIPAATVAAHRPGQPRAPARPRCRR